ncbi:MAG TPA: tyrosine-type recombinase/integrase, partial [Syntrophales bacterium]|nr:tyrosine-type recombinase/integrase [Syntrophales bacterium]
MGSIYKRGKTYWIKYYRQGKPYRESTKSEKEADAKRLLKKREGEIADGKLPGVYFDRIRFDELAEDFLADYRINQKKSTARAERCIKHLKREFEGARATDITTPRIQAYIEKRLAEGAENATVNRELAALKRLLNLGARQTPPKVDRVPYIPMLQENNVRKGFFEHGDFLAVRKALPEYLRGFVTFAYKVGWRFTEISTLTWAQVDLNQGIVRLEAGETKNAEGREVYLDEELKKVFIEQAARRVKAGKLSPYVFPNQDGTDRIKDIRGAWGAACIAAGLFRLEQAGEKTVKVPTRLFHDFRRTAVRNMVRAGIPERVAM